MRQAEFAKRTAHQCTTGRDMMRLGKPPAQFGQSGIRPGFHLGLNSRVKPSQLRRNMASLRTGRQLPGLIAATEDLGDIRDTDAQSLGNLPDRLSSIASSKNTVTQILRVSRPRTPSHFPLSGQIQPEVCESHPPPDSQAVSRFQSAQARSNCLTPDFRRAQPPISRRPSARTKGRHPP
jgi:hypothetical protein